MHCGPSPGPIVLLTPTNHGNEPLLSDGSILFFRCTITCPRLNRGPPPRVLLRSMPAVGLLFTSPLAMCRGACPFCPAFCLLDDSLILEGLQTAAAMLPCMM